MSQPDPAQELYEAGRRYAAQLLVEKNRTLANMAAKVIEEHRKFKPVGNRHARRAQLKTRKA